MYSPVNKALFEVRQRIPKEILNRVFGNNSYYNQYNTTSVDDQILSLVIRPRVMVDCNIVGGEEVLIDLSNIPPDLPYQNTYVFRIPKSFTKNKSIVSVLSVNTNYAHPNGMYSSMNTGYLNTGATDINALSALGMHALNSASPIPVVNFSDISLVAENTIVIKNIPNLSRNLTLRCMVSNDENLSNLQPRTLLNFSDLVVLAVKAFIYNEYIIRLDVGEIHAGQNLGVFKDIIEEYKDANEMYGTYLRETWAKTAVFNDRERYNRFLSIMVGGPR